MGIRMEPGQGKPEGSGGESADAGLEGRVHKLEEDNRMLNERVAGLIQEIDQLRTTVGALMVSYNGHTAMIESHRGALNVL